MTQQHPLTDEICYQITWAERIKISDEDDMRYAADWQLEQVIEWFRGNDMDEKVINDLREAMRPQQQEDN